MSSRVVLWPPAMVSPTPLWGVMCALLWMDEETMSAWSTPHHGGVYSPHHARNLIRSASHIPVGAVPREAEHIDLLDET